MSLPTSELDHVLYADSSVIIGLFECPVDHPLFKDSGPASGDLVVFPRSPVEIVQAGRRAVIADHSVMTLYNEGQEYKRKPLAAKGDRSLFLKFPRDVVVEALRETGQAHRALEHSPFRAAHSVCSCGAFLRARRLLQSLLQDSTVNPLALQESAYGLLYHAAANQPLALTKPGRRPRTEARHRKLVEDCQAFLASHFGEDLSLQEIATELATTPFHLSRVFSEHTGQTIHRQLMKLRLRASLDLLIDEPDRTLTDIGLDLRFATPSHFTARFRHSFGSTPGAFRRKRWGHTAN